MTINRNFFTLTLFCYLMKLDTKKEYNIMTVPKNPISCGEEEPDYWWIVNIFSRRKIRFKKILSHLPNLLLGLFSRFN